MTRSARSVFASAMLATTFAAAAAAQTTVATGPATAASPHVKTTWTIEGAEVSIEYGRPSLRGRPEAQMMPVGAPWRTGADEATLITSDKPLTFGAVALAPGTYTINTQPGEKDWEIIFGKLGKAGQWGTPYLPALEMSRSKMSLGKAKSPVEQLTYSIDGSGARRTLRIEWGTTSVTAPFTIGK